MPPFQEIHGKFLTDETQQKRIGVSAVLHCFAERGMELVQRLRWRKERQVCL